jgi:HlyD family secretion protein
MKTSIKSITRFVLPLILFSTLSNFGCKKSEITYDASGTFESKEIIVSAEATGKILSFKAEEGDIIQADQSIVQIDDSNLSLQKDQAVASLQALGQKQNSAQPQILVLNQQYDVAESQIKSLETQRIILKREQVRIQKLFEGKAATSQQVDDINGKLDVLDQQIKTAEQQKDVLKAQIKSAKEQVSIQNRGINSESLPLKKRVDLINDQLNKTVVKASKAGTILTKYAEEGEFITTGKPLYKVADLSEMTLKAYITGDQLSKVKISDMVEVFVDNGSEDYLQYKGKISFISDKAEFTPKTIQTKDERANLVYPIKIIVKNDGKIKIGMFGEVSFAKNQTEK